jgi:serine/threonine protein kinase
LEWIKPYLSDAKKFQLILDPRLDKKQVIKSAQKLSAVANRCLVKNPKSRPKMSEVLQMVNGIIESSSSDNSNIPSKNVSRVEVLHDAEINKKRTMDQKPGESNWFVRMWRPKLVRTC